MGSDVVFSSLYLDRSDSVVFGLPGSFMDPHGLARSSLTGCSSRRGHDRYLTEPLRSTQPVRTSRHLDSIMPLHLGEVTCSRIDDSMLSDLRPIIHFGAIQGHISIRMRFTDHEGVACLSLFGEISPLVCMIIHGYEIHARSMFDLILSGYSVEPLLSHSARFIPFDIVDRSGTFDAILGHISVSIEIYGSSWSCMLIPTYEIHVDTMFPPWSLSGVTQLGLHFATPRCHHVFLPGDALLIYGSDSVVHVDDLGRAFDDGASSYFWSVWGIPLPPSCLGRSPTVSSLRASPFVSDLSPPLTFRVTIITFQFRRSEPSPCFQLRRSEPSLVFRSTFRVASSVSTFRVVITSQFDVQGHRHYFLVSAFRAIIGFQIDIQSRILSFDVPSHHHYFQCGVQSHHRFSVLAFIAITASRAISIISFRLPEPSLSSRLGFQSHHCRLGLASRASFYFLSSVSRVGLVIQGHNSWRSYPLALRILPSGSCIRPRFSSLRYPVLIAYSSRTLGWFDRYSSLTWSFESFLEIS
ncbi:hypothetical protein CK203_043725 [Vitis vinifera]|uniref:Uncharacterized protein n=1 Tax=Vitis vinifera TaxID=29760 RepID=A0A438GYQ1_VITVI|nr:hypothetical protein CK203_043725 [Vitis vinifera]